MTNTARWTTGLLLIAAATMPAAAQSVLYGVTGEAPSTTNPETLFKLKKSDATTSLAFPLGNGADGEAIAFNPKEQKMYHWSGGGSNVMESIDLKTQVVTGIPQSGDAHGEILCATWDPFAGGRFIVVSNVEYKVFIVTTQGHYTLIGAPEANLKGIAFAGGHLYAVESNAGNIYELDPANAALSLPQAVSAPGITDPIAGFNGLATDPDTGIMWAILRTGGAQHVPGTRYLGTITPAGVFTSVGVLNDSFASIAFEPGAAIKTDGTYQVRYASNLTAGDAVINISNTGANGNSLFGPGYGFPAGNICVNVYAFSPDEQMISCCSCLVTPNGLVHVTANNDLVSNTLTGIRPNSIVIKLVATATGKERRHHEMGADTDEPSYSGSSCTNSAAQIGGNYPLADAGLLAWGTTVHSMADNDPPVGPFSITETPFLPATLSTEDNSELASLANRCTSIIGNGSSFGICRSCRLGGLGADKQ